MFVTLEGIDRSGKTTHAALVADLLGSETKLLREPGHTVAGERLREMLKDPALALAPESELMLFEAARAELVSQVIRPGLEAGADIVCDRYVDSTVAYQGVGRGLGVEVVEFLNNVAVGDCMPDLTILLRVDPKAAAQRHGTGDDRFEVEGIDFQRRVAEAYDQLAERNPDRIRVVDANAAPEEVVRQIRELIQ